jgi:predicted nuclease of restriction endonuclease-like (RecB) superfamily
VENQKKFDWGKSVVKNLSEDLQSEFPGIRGFSERNLWNMRNFYLAYFQDQRTLPLLGEVGWTHHIAILEKVKEPLPREYYMHAVRRYGWTANVLVHKIESGDFERFALSKSNNFDRSLPDAIKNQAKLAVKDHYVFDFLEMGDDYSERQLEDALITHLQDFIRELGHGEFAFLGRQFKITVEDEDFFIDLLFYHRTLRCLVAFELKIGRFEPEYAGKLNFYLKALDMHIKKKEENPSIGIILCKDQKRTIVEYAFSDIEKPMGVATYSKILPNEYKKFLPSPEEIEMKIEEWTAKEKVSKELPKEQTISLPSTNHLLSPRQARFLNSVTTGTQMTSEEYAKRMEVSSSTALRDLVDLSRKDYVKKIAKRRNSCYVIIKVNVT